ncbi:hypothetical protein [Emticicia fontis]
MEFKSDISIDGKLTISTVATESTSMAALFRASTGDVTTRVLGSMALQGTGSYYDKTTADNRYLQSVTLGLPASLFSITSSVATAGSPNLTASFVSQNANKVFAGPSAGADAIPTFRQLVIDDVSGLQMTLDAKISGSGSSGYIPKFTGTKVLAPSLIYEYNGRIGINNSNPSSYYTVDIIGDLKTTTLSVGDNRSYGLSIGMANPLDNYAQIGVGADTLRHVVIANYTWSTFSGGLNFTQRMKLDATGLAIGTGTAAYPLDVSGDVRVNGGGILRFWRSDNATQALIINAGTSNSFVTATVGGLILSSAGAMSFDSASGHNFRSSGGTTTYMTVSSTGNVGVGFSSPSYKLDVNGTGHFVGAVLFDAIPSTPIAPTTGNHITNKTYVDAKTWTASAITDLQPLLDAKVSGSGTAGYIAKYTGILTQGNSVLFESAGGNIGLGTILPTYKLDVSGDIRVNGGSLLRLWRPDSTTQGLTISAGSSNNFITASNGGLILTSAAAMSFDSPSGHNFRSSGGTTTYMTVSSTGNVGIGFTSPSYKLDVNGTARFAGTAQFDVIPTCSISATSGSHLVNFTTLLAYASGIRYDKNKLKTVAMSNITLSGHQTIAGYTTSGTTDRVLVMGQTDATKNGIYIANSSTWTRDTNFNDDNEMRGAIHTIESGTYAGYKYVNTNTTAMTVDGAGASNITYAEFSNLVESDPVWTAFQTSQDITPTRVGQWNSAYSVTSGITPTRLTNWDAAYTFSTTLTSTSALLEGSNLYFTNARVRSATLTGFTTGVNTSITASDTVLTAFQNAQTQLNNKLSFGGDSRGASISVGTNDNFDFILERNNSIQATFKSGVVDFNYDVNVLGKIKLNGATGSDHQFIKYNGSGNEWTYLNTGELSDKDDIVMLQNIAGERGFQMYSDSAKTYADAFIFTNTVSGVALGIHGYANDDTDTLKEFGLQLAVDGLLYHKKLDGTRKQIATVDMITGGTTNNWNGGAVTGDIYVPFGKSIWWDFENAGSFITMYEAGQPPISSARTMWINSNNYLTMSASQNLSLKAQKILFTTGTGSQIEVDFSNASSFSDGQYLRFQKSTSGGMIKLTIVSD